MAADLDIWMTAARNQDDKQAFAQVVAHCHHLLRASILRETANPDLADEIAQETFVRGWTKREQYRPGTSPRAWLLTIARTRLIEHHRHQDRGRRHMKDLIQRELLRHRDDSEDDAIKSSRMQALRACMEGIREDQKELIELVHNQGLSSDDAAALLGIKGPTCRQRLSRLQRALKKCAEDRLAQEQA